VLLHQSFNDPAAASGSDEEVLAQFEHVRDEKKKWIEESFAAGECLFHSNQLSQ
jgi:hypothetical protein